MSETKFTPGPWHVIEHSWSDVGVYAGDNRGVLLSIYDEATVSNQQELEQRDSANANLIAAAPELYEALEKLLEGLMLDTGPIFDRILAAECAMRKARGES